MRVSESPTSFCLRNQKQMNSQSAKKTTKSAIPEHMQKVAAFRPAGEGRAAPLETRYPGMSPDRGGWEALKTAQRIGVANGDKTTLLLALALLHTPLVPDRPPLPLLPQAHEPSTELFPVSPQLHLKITSPDDPVEVIELCPCSGQLFT